MSCPIHGIDEWNAIWIPFDVFDDRALGIIEEIGDIGIVGEDDTMKGIVGGIEITETFEEFEFDLCFLVEAVFRCE